MPINWDWLISGGIILGLILSIAARMSQQTIIELLRDIKDFISESREEAVEGTQEVIYA